MTNRRSVYTERKNEDSHAVQDRVGQEGFHYTT